MVAARFIELLTWPTHKTAICLRIMLRINCCDPWNDSVPPHFKWHFAALLIDDNSNDRTDSQHIARNVRHEQKTGRCTFTDSNENCIILFIWFAFVSTPGIDHDNIIPLNIRRMRDENKWQTLNYCQARPIKLPKKAHNNGMPLFHVHFFRVRPHLLN